MDPIVCANIVVFLVCSGMGVSWLAVIKYLETPKPTFIEAVWANEYARFAIEAFTFFVLGAYVYRKANNLCEKRRQSIDDSIVMTRTN